MRYSSTLAAAVLVACPLTPFALEPGDDLAVMLRSGGSRLSLWDEEH
jgi:hypothetical protein